VGGERLEVGANACAARRIETSNGENYRQGMIVMVVQRTVPSAPGTNAGGTEMSGASRQEL
jgi:hypothetical protein